MARLPRKAEWRTLLHHVMTGKSAKLREMFRGEGLWLGYHGGSLGPLRPAWDKCKSNRLEILRLLVEQGWDVTAEKFEEEEESVVRACLEEGPRWRQDARDESIAEVRVAVSKAWGLSFVPGDLRCPVRYGGDYDGRWPVTAEYALESLEKDLASGPTEFMRSAAWFRPFLEKMAKKRGFKLSAVLRKVERPHQILRVR